MIHRFIYGLGKIFVFIIIGIMLFEASAFSFITIYTKINQSAGNGKALVDYWEYDPYLIWAPAKNKTGYSRHSSYRMNNYGFRGNDIKKEKYANTYRIAVLGGSTGWGTGVTSNDNLWTSIIEKKLNEKAIYKKVEVLNACCTGYTSFQELITLVFKVLEFKPDVVIVLDGYNDIYLGSLCSEQDYIPNISPSYKAYKKFFMQPAWKKAYSLVWHGSYTNALINRIIDKYYYTRILSKTPLYVHTEAIDNYLMNLKTMSDILKGRSIKSIFIFQPYLGSIHKELSSAEQSLLEKNKTARPYITELMSIAGKKFEFFLKDNDVEGLNLNNYFQDIDKDTTIWFDHVHLNDKGNALLADIVLERLAKIMPRSGGN